MYILYNCIMLKCLSSRYMLQMSYNLLYEDNTSFYLFEMKWIMGRVGRRASPRVEVSNVAWSAMSDECWCTTTSPQAAWGDTIPATSLNSPHWPTVRDVTRECFNQKPQRSGVTWPACVLPSLMDEQSDDDFFQSTDKSYTCLYWLFSTRM